MEYKVICSDFEGPMDLLLHLIKQSNMDIFNISIEEIAKQYLDYINMMEKLNLTVASEYLVMAAELLEIKSGYLLPKKEVDTDDEFEEDPRDELVKQLLEYKMYKYMSLELRDRELDAGRAMYKKPTVPEEVLQYEAPVDLDKLLEDVTLSKLNDIFKQVMQRVEDKVDPIRSKFGKIEKEEVNLPEKMEYVKEYARNHKHFSFKDLLLQQTGKMQVIVTFLAILELMKIGFINIIQEEIFDDILIDLAE